MRFSTPDIHIVESDECAHRNGLIGDYDYAYLFIPRLPFTKQTRKSAPFFGLDDRVPVVLALILGLQHALAMLAGGEFASDERWTTGE